MTALSPLDEVVQDLEQHENSIRIKKLIFCACKKNWENDPTALDQVKLLDLIKELLDLSPTIEHLTVALNSVVKTLNKQAEYSLVANIILSTIGKLYPDSEESTLVVSSRSHYTTEESVPQQPFVHLQEVKWNEPKRHYDPFELRLEIMRYTNPLRAKILVFSTLHQKSEFHEQDWFIIKTHKLDDLLLRLFRTCETITELEFQLNSTARCLNEADQYTQAASVIIRALRLFYPSL